MRQDALGTGDAAVPGGASQVTGQAMEQPVENNNIGIGTADNTAAAQAWLNSCEAVIDWKEISNSDIEFRYDPSVEVTIVPHFVHF